MTNDRYQSATDPEFEELCKSLEHFETPAWAIEAILDVELFSDIVWDPCTGTGCMAAAANARGYKTLATDIHDWGHLSAYGQPITKTFDFLGEGHRDFWTDQDGDLTIFMNPPFSKAERFVKVAHDLGARKIVCFQRFAWWEAAIRRHFWENYTPSRIHICGARANCWRHDIPEEKRKGGSSPTAHAWFVWERGHPPGPTLSHIWKD